MQTERKWYVWFIFGLLAGGGGLFLLIGVLSITAAQTAKPGLVEEIALEGPETALKKVVLVNLKGTIVRGGQRPGLTEFALAALRQAEDDPTVSSVIIDIDTPGGSVTDSDEIYERLRRLRAANKTVTFIFGSLCASGGYYIAAAADQIWARPTSVTGSIGVIIPHYSIVKLLATVGIDDLSHASGENKQMLSPTRVMTDEQAAIVDGVVAEMYDRFVNLVAEGRKLDIEEAKRIADGRLFSAKQALQLKLVDRIGYLDELIEESLTEGGSRLVEYRAPVSVWDAILAQSSSNPLYEWFGSMRQLNGRLSYLHQL